MEELQHVMRTNLESGFSLSQLCHPLLKTAKGCIVFNSSVAGGPVAMKSGTPYAMSKVSFRICFCYYIFCCTQSHDGYRSRRDSFFRHRPFLPLLLLLLLLFRRLP